MAQMQRKPAVVILMLVVLAIAWWLENRQQGSPPKSGPAGKTAGTDSPRGDDGALRGAIRAKRSKVWVEGEGEIVHLLPDDRIAPRHQLCLVELDWGHTIKISHNVDLAPTVPWKKGDRLAFRGRFEWNDKGGVVHWTHHDPRGRQEGGWLRHRDRRYE